VLSLVARCSLLLKTTNTGAQKTLRLSSLAPAEVRAYSDLVVK